MFLKQIKMMGFKSFVEPTTLQLNAQKIAVVGPNGCGKSNVIDAIRWVMGESSARFLRGDMMADVIFNGSLHRKALSMASVEMILDNSQGYLQGAYVKKGDVSLKREMNRTGESTYYINHQKVRRKDLTDLWLGTGAGARGYAIIGQNMVNQLVEANPEVLKLYLEEAAGVSKYKERRKESADRLSQTAENLSRIDDLIQELEQTLMRLEKESQDAICFQKYRQELRQYQDYLEYIKAQRILDKRTNLQKSLAEQETLEQSSLKDIEHLKIKLADIHDTWQNLQTKTHELEQDIYKSSIHLQQQQTYFAQRQEQQLRLKQENEQLYQEQLEVTQQQQEEQQTLLASEKDFIILQDDLQEIAKQLQTIEQQKTHLQTQLRERQQKRGQIRHQYQQHFTQWQVLKAKNEHTLQMLTQMKSEIEILKLRFQQNACDDIEKKIKNLETQLPTHELQLSHLRTEYGIIQKDYQTAKEHHEVQQEVFVKSQVKWNTLRQDMLGKEAGYLGLLGSYVPENINVQEHWRTIKDWLLKWSIPPEWQKTMDWLWQHFLPHFYCQSEQLLEVNNPIAGGYYARMQKVSSCLASSMLNKMQVDTLPVGFLNWEHIHLADDLKQAKALVLKLNANASVLCPEGVWLGRDWVYYLPLEQTSQQGLATRLHDWRLAEQVFLEFEPQFQEVQQKLEESRIQMQQHQQKLENQMRLLEEKERFWFEQQQQLQTMLQQHQFLSQEKIRQQQEYHAAEEKYAKLLGQTKAWQLEIDEHFHAYEKEKSLEEVFSKEIDDLNKNMLQIEKDHLSFSQQLQEKKLHLTRLKTQYEQIQAQHPKTLHRLNQLSQKINENQCLLDNFEKELHTPRDSWEEQTHLIAKKQEHLEALKIETQVQSELKDEVTQKLEKQKNNHLVILEKKWKLLSETEQNQSAFEEIQDKLESTTLVIPKELNETLIKKHIEQLEGQLQELGDVNLLAVGLFKQEKLRISHLHEQQDDLKQAIEELQIAIQTLDKDMQIRLEETLLAINQHLTEIFPQLFGGGEAKFVASCDNLLDASVAVHVQLPGKKQHRIQLLSGGEKALTAVALLFSIFSLNPAPFCLLDEVDAALDDANVQRLAGLIDKLSSSVQFLLITHNPLTMEVADELIGVTMQEPGVSRVVSVNMARALEMVNKE